MTFDTVDDLLKALRGGAPIDQDFVNATADLFERTPAEDVVALCAQIVETPAPRVYRLNDELTKDMRFAAAMKRSHEVRGPRPTPDAPHEESFEERLAHEESFEERLAHERRNVVVNINHVLGELESPVTEETLAHARTRLTHLRDDTQEMMDTSYKVEP